MDLVFPIASSPALAALVRSVHTLSLHDESNIEPDILQLADLFSPTPRYSLVQAYTVQGRTIEQEAERAAHVLRHVLERLRRVAFSYGEWTSFDAPAYFDLTRPQASQFVLLEERVRSVHCTFFVDGLLPSFQAARDFFVNEFIANYQNRLRSVEAARLFFEESQPTMIAHWKRHSRVIAKVRARLVDDINFLTMNAARQDRWRWRAAWSSPPAPALDPSLLPTLNHTPSLTLATEFALPVWRQPGRLRRLWRNREVRRRGK